MNWWRCRSLHWTFCCNGEDGGTTGESHRYPARRWHSFAYWRKRLDEFYRSRRPGLAHSCCLSSAELYDSATSSFIRTAGMAAGRAGHTATLLNSGKVLIAGGGNAFAEIYTPPVLIPTPLLFSLTGDGRGQGAIWHAT